MNEVTCPNCNFAFDLNPSKKFKTKEKVTSKETVKKPGVKLTRVNLRAILDKIDKRRIHKQSAKEFIRGMENRLEDGDYADLSDEQILWLNNLAFHVYIKSIKYVDLEVLQG